MALLLNQQLLVAGDTLREISSLLVRSIKWSYHHRVNTTQSSTHGLGLGTKQIDIAVKQCLIIDRGGSIDNHLRTIILCVFVSLCSIIINVLLNNLSPQQACCTELGNLHKIVLAYTHIELNALCCKVCIDTSIRQLLQILITPSQRIAQLLNDISTCIIQCVGTYRDTAEVRIVIQGLDKLRTKRKDRSHILALHDHLGHRIPLDRANQFLLVVALLLEELN